MSDLIINIRFWSYHLQVGKGFKYIKFVKNKYFTKKVLKNEKRIEIYKFF